MRQSMLDFGQRPQVAPKSTAGSQARTSHGASGDSSSSAPAAPMKRPATASDFFAKRERKDDEGFEVVKAVSTRVIGEDVPRPPQKRSLEPQRPRRMRPIFPDAPWPTREDIHVQPDGVLPGRGTRPTPSLRLPRPAVEGQEVSQENLDSIWPWSQHHNSNYANGTDPARCDTAGRANGTAGRSAHLQEQCTSDLTKHASLWTDRSRPRSASSVLGNERQALYMRDWLHALQVTGARGTAGGASGGVEGGGPSQQPRQVTKRVQKKRGRPASAKEMADFIIGDDDEEETWFDQFRKAGSPPHIEEAEEETDVEAMDDGNGCDFARANHLTNVIVLVGPTGCGKTASVYACAHELGFEVFELFPGMGRRSGKEITSVVGDVGRNHMVASGGTGGGAFQKASMSKLDAFFNLAPAVTPTAPATRSMNKPRQSLILFEEVDILYDDDKGFWPALVELVGDSRRPVVLTCNDLSVVQLDDLPVQCILQFVAPNVEVAAPYLQSVAAQEGYELPIDFVAKIYANGSGAGEDLRRDEELLLSDNGPLHPDLSINLDGARLDLRQALTQLQFSCQRLDGNSPSKQPSQSPTALRAYISAAETRSSADALFARPHARAVEELDEDNRKATPDDVQAPSSWLRKPLLRGDEVALPAVGQENAFKAALCQLAQTRLDTAQEAATYHRARLAYSRATDDVTASLSVAYQSRVPSHEAVLDYAAAIVKMVEVDDAEEAAHQARVSEQLDEARQLQNRGSGGSGQMSAAWSEARVSLDRIGIRSSRQSSRLLLQRDADGKLQLGQRETAFVRWLLLEDATLAHARTLAIQWRDGA